MKGRNAEKTITDFTLMLLGTREGLFPTTFAKKSVRIYSCGREKEREMEGGR